MGGVIIWITVLGLSFIFFVLNYFFDNFWKNFNIVDRAQTYLPIAAMLIAAILGLIDDLLGIKRIGPNGGGISIKHKLFIYFIIALIGAFWFSVKLGWETLYIPFVGNVEIDGWYFPLFIFIMVATAFSANETDGLDGLLGGVSLFSFGSLAVIWEILDLWQLE
jgi:UDP-N-acetylmuramyl pentapeptide phosphotransferase/UDP-N-acetylglucosamine-1-phosphate transferase